MITLSDGRNELYQWDTGREIVSSDPVNQFHFSNKVYGRTVDVDAIENKAKIPDFLLQSSTDLTVYAFSGTPLDGFTKVERIFKVHGRNKPADYVFTPTEQTTIEEIKQIAQSVRDDADAGKFNGKQGERGERGEQGIQGERGPIGPIGLTGPQGEKGKTGERGPEGKTGPEGPRGMTGLPGPQGEAGPRGPKGETGPQGEIGPAGPIGPQGETGPKGDTGPIGPKGDKGDTGLTGPQGEPGPQGLPGKDGVQVNDLKFTEENPLSGRFTAQNFAGAFKNQVSGEVIAVDDVSPVEHEVKCRVESKNLLPYPYPERNPSEKNGVKFNCRDDGIIDISGKSTGAVQYDYVKNMELTPGIYTLSGFSNSVFSGKVARIYVRGSQDTIAELRSIDAKVTFILDHTENVKIYLLLVPAGVNVSGNIALKLERGNTATPYTPYIPDLSKVEVSKYTSNIWTGKKDFTLEGNGIQADLTSQEINKKTTLFFDCDVICENITSSSNGNLVFMSYITEETGPHYPTIVGTDNVTNRHISTKLSDGTETIEKISLTKVDRFTGGKILLKNCRLSIMQTNYPYEPYDKADYTPLSSGEVQGMISLSPNMTIISDTPGVVINAEYNLDGKKYIDKKVEELKNAVLSLGGNI